MALSAAIEAARKRLEQLIDEGTKLIATGQRSGVSGNAPRESDYFLVPDTERLSAWRTSSEQVIRRLAGERSHYLETFKKNKGAFVSEVRACVGVMRGLVSDVDAGQLHDVPMLIRAEVFADFLEQAIYLLGEGFYVAAAVLAGGVLEDTRRRLCVKFNVTLPVNPKIESMNPELTKAGAYNLLVQKQITAWADLRNKAAHGKPTEFTPKQVAAMIEGVRDFVAKHLA